jgi:hypothetical protein
MFLPDDELERQLAARRAYLNSAAGGPSSPLRVPLLAAENAHKHEIQCEINELYDELARRKHGGPQKTVLYRVP